jgi:hypothetical protein
MDTPVQQLTLRLYAEQTATIVRVDLMTMDGRHLPSLEAVELPANTWTTLTLEMSDFRSVQPDSEQPLWLVSLQQHAAAITASASVQIGEVEIN